MSRLSEIYASLEERETLPNLDKISQEISLEAKQIIKMKENISDLGAMINGINNITNDIDCVVSSGKGLSVESAAFAYSGIDAHLKMVGLTADYFLPSLEEYTLTNSLEATKKAKKDSRSAVKYLIDKLIQAFKWVGSLIAKLYNKIMGVLPTMEEKLEVVVEKAEVLKSAGKTVVPSPSTPIEEEPVKEEPIEDDQDEKDFNKRKSDLFAVKKRTMEIYERDAVLVKSQSGAILSRDVMHRMGLVTVNSPLSLKHIGEIRGLSIYNGLKSCKLYANEWAKDYLAFAEKVYKYKIEEIVDVSKMKDYEPTTPADFSKDNVEANIYKGFTTNKILGSIMSGDATIEELQDTTIYPKPHVFFKYGTAKDKFDMDHLNLPVPSFSTIQNMLQELGQIIEGLKYITSELSGKGDLQKLESKMISLLIELSTDKEFDKDSPNSKSLNDKTISLIKSITTNYSTPVVALSKHLLVVFNAALIYCSNCLDVYDC